MKTQQARQITSSACSIDFNGLSYSPALLLDARLDASITDDPEFHSACEWGFNGALDDIEEVGLDAVLPHGVRFFVRREIGQVHPLVGQVPLVSRVGVALGWLSALALAQYQEAQEGLSELVRLLDREQRSQQWPPSNSRSVDSAGWPLDM